MNFPKELYRGDNDSSNWRQLRSTFKHNNFFSNLVAGGDGSRILKEPVFELVNQHVLSKYCLSDFLSFTENERSAFRYGMHLQMINQDLIDECCDYYEENNTGWDFAILTFSFSRVEVVKKIAEGIYEARYSAELNELKPYYRIIIIDVITALAENFHLFNTYRIYLYRCHVCRDEPTAPIGWLCHRLWGMDFILLGMLQKRKTIQRLKLVGRTN